ncbi:hypothetical protein H7K28_01180 [Paenibacillus polymyxa]|uniref:hypothetical protein n=1 Tax=Paenibacillus TaxID=44249 RepID=UPI000D3106A2|nr:MULTISPECIES: hypothetical protein [Paenibacillus]KAF6621400.1 hypothetical protein HFE00_01760 [Paenibacillus sp. EKM101P]KAF6622705.1 hypothetical protein HFE03_11225 [Paenibacillus sp. EKM102P]KAF6632554.1 hypothetical protein HFE01_11260 [Paenibacillus sp. EKM10P]KAF6647309.1 hypothetical protein HFE02_13320 [Paenibacillus sp. EKM11P]MBY0022085.1 hypothetical protein [Paenibacillus polymyxa]
MKIALHKKLACLIVLGGILTVVATGFGGDKEPYKLPDKPKEAAVSTFSEYMNASMSRDYDKMLSLSDDYRFKTERARLNFLKAQGAPIDYRIMSVDDSDPSRIVVSSITKYEDMELPPIKYILAFEEGDYKLQMRNVVVNMIPSSPDYKTVEYEPEKVDDDLENNFN